MIEFKSKIGYEILLSILLLLSGIAYIPILIGAPLGVIILIILINALVFILMVYTFVQTKYQIKEGRLLIKSGFLFHTTVDILKIKKIKRTRNPISSPAASLERIELTYGNNRSVIISPNNKLKFVIELLKINRKIHHDLNIST